MTKKKIKRSGDRDVQGPRLKPHSASEVNWDNERPIFSMHLMPDSHCVTECNEEERAALADALFKRSQFTWRDLKTKPRHGLGYEKIARLKVPWPPGVTEDVTMIAFRFSGLKPMVGYREQNIFHILWLDRDFSVYDHGS